MRMSVAVKATVGAPIVEICRRRLQAAVAAGRVPEKAGRVAENQLDALQASVRHRELTPVDAALQAVDVLELAAGGRWEAYDAA